MVNRILDAINQRMHRRSSTESLWRKDKSAFQQFNALSEKYTDEIANTLREKCKKDGIPWIDPLYFTTFFVIGMNRLHEASSEFVLKQCLSSTHPDDLNIAPSVAKNLLTEYHTKLTVLEKIITSKKENEDLVVVNPIQVSEARNALDELERKLRLDSFYNMTSAIAQREHLRRISYSLQAQVLPRILTASEPIYSAAQQIMPIALDLIQQN